MRFLRLIFGCTIFVLPHAVLAKAPSDVAEQSVVEIRAYFPNGKLSLGSAVVVRTDMLATNCHVTRGAHRVEIVAGGRALPASISGGDFDRDVCFLQSAKLSRTPAEVTRHISVGQKVFAAGFPADQRLTLTEGRIVALHRYDGARVIQVSAPFDYGASGGALLDENGRLLGMLTFKARAGRAFHFVVPAQWLQAASGMPGEDARQAFWERRSDELPYFLRAVSMEAAGNWSGLATVAAAWTEQDPMDRDAWQALGKAQAHMNNHSASARAFERANQISLLRSATAQPLHRNATDTLPLLVPTSGFSAVANPRSDFLVDIAD